MALGDGARHLGWSEATASFASVCLDCSWDVRRRTRSYSIRQAKLHVELTGHRVLSRRVMEQLTVPAKRGDE